MTEKPLLLLDVDGVLNPEPGSNGRRPEGYQTHRTNPLTSDGVTDWVTRFRKPLRIWLNPQHGAELLKLAELYELVWCTTWEHEANDWIGPHLGLPALPFIPFVSMLPPKPPVPGLHWKTSAVIEYAAGRPFVWVDDETGQRDTEYVGKNHPGKFSLMKIKARIGLVQENFDELKGWQHGWLTETATATDTPGT